MKIIDLYNLLANKKYDELPKKIKVRNIIYDFHKDEDFINYEPKNGDWLLNQFLWKLNEEIEIIEEKEIEKLTLNGELIGYGSMEEWLDFQLNGNEKKICSAIEYLGIKINNLIDEINKLKENK